MTTTKELYEILEHNIIKEYNISTDEKAWFPRLTIIYVDGSESVFKYTKIEEFDGKFKTLGIEILEDIKKTEER